MLMAVGWLLSESKTRPSIIRWRRGEGIRRLERLKMKVITAGRSSERNEQANSCSRNRWRQAASRPGAGCAAAIRRGPKVARATSLI